MGPDEQKVDARLAVVQPAVAKEGPQENSAVERAQQEIAERVHSFAHPCSFLHLFHHEVTFCGGFDHARETSDLWEIALCDNTADHFVDHHDNPKHETGRVTFSRGTNPDHGRCLPPQRVVTPLRADVVGERFPFREFATGRFNKTNIGWFLYVPMDNGVSTNLNRWSSIKQMGSIYI